MCCLAALAIDCTNTMYAITGSNANGETFPSSVTHALLRVNKVTAVGTAVCSFSTTDLIQVGAFITTTVIAHFSGSTNPTMDLVTPTAQRGSLCATVYVGNDGEGCLDLRFPH